MTTLFGPILAAALMFQFHGGTLQSTVIDDQGKPVAGAEVVYHAPAPWGSKVGPLEVRAMSDAQGRFRIVAPPRPVNIRRAGVWAFRPGLAIVAVPGFRELPGSMVLHKVEPRTINIEGPEGQPLAGVRVSPKLTSIKTEADGRFTLGGFCQGPVCLFASGEGFRFFGRLIKPGDGEVSVELTRTRERPTREMRMLPDPIPLEESRALARHLFEPYWKIVDEKNDAAKYSGLRTLVLVDPIGVLQRRVGIEFPGPRMKGALQTYVAQFLAQSDPAEAETVAEAVNDPGGRAWALIAVLDPARARRLTDQSQGDRDRPQLNLFLALGQRSSDPAEASQAFQTAMRGIDRSMRDGSEDSPAARSRDVLLPLVEQIDPALVPEYFWRIVATRPAVGNPSRVDEGSSAWLSLLLAWYDRDVAAAVFEPVRAGLERADDRELASASSAIASRARSIFDPRAAVARLQQVSVDPKLDLDADYARRWVAELLSLPHEARWRYVWDNYSDMARILRRDIYRLQ